MQQTKKPMWYIVVICTEDWYTIYLDTVVVSACSLQEAHDAALMD